MPPLLQKLLLLDLAAEAQPEAEGFLQVLEGLRGLLVGDETTVDVLIDDEQAYLVQTAAGGHQLGYDVLADAVLGQHAVYTTDLALDAPQAGEDRFDFGLCLDLRLAH